MSETQMTLPLVNAEECEIVFTVVEHDGQIEFHHGDWVADQFPGRYFDNYYVHVIRDGELHVTETSARIKYGVGFEPGPRNPFLDSGSYYDGDILLFVMASDIWAKHLEALTIAQCAVEGAA